MKCYQTIITIGFETYADDMDQAYQEIQDKFDCGLGLDIKFLDPEDQAQYEREFL